MNPNNPWGLYNKMDNETKSPVKSSKLTSGSLSRAATLKEL